MNSTVKQINMKMKRNQRFTRNVHRNLSREKAKTKCLYQNGKWTGRQASIAGWTSYIYQLYLHFIQFTLNYFFSFFVLSHARKRLPKQQMKLYAFLPLWPLTVDHSCPIRWFASILVLAIGMKSEITCRNVDLVKNSNWRKTLMLVHTKTKHLKHFCFFFSFCVECSVANAVVWLGFKWLILYGVAH